MIYNFSRVSYGRTTLKKHVAMQDSIVTDLEEENEELKKEIEELKAQMEDMYDEDYVNHILAESQDNEDSATHWENEYNDAMEALEEKEEELREALDRLEKYEVIEEKTGMDPEDVADMMSNLQTSLETIKCPNCS